MASEFKIGRLRFSWKGVWTPATAYARDDVVSYQGKTYVCLLPNTSDVSSFYSDLYKVSGTGAQTPYWNLVVDGKTFLGNWATSTVYSLGNLVIFGGVVYYANTQHTSTTFALQSSYWTIYTTFTAWRSAGWLPNYVYGVNDLVKYGGIVYECVANHTSAATTLLGLEANQSNWTIVENGIEYKGAWASATRYKINDIVKLDVDLYTCITYNADATFTPAKWTIYLPGQGSFSTWSSSKTFQLGDVVSYGGYDYISATANNLNNVPSLDAVDWTLLNQGYEIRSDWTSVDTYKVGSIIRRNGQVFVAVSDNSGQDPVAFVIQQTYNSTGSSGVNVNVLNTAGIQLGMNVIGVGITQGQVVAAINSNTIVLNKAPDGTLTNSQFLNFVGVNYVYWKLVVTGSYWTKTWASGTTYAIGDLAIWQNSTYICTQRHTAAVLTRPDNDLTNTYWTTFIAHARKNAMNTQGDIEIYSSTVGGYNAIPLSSNSYVLRSTNNTPTWTKINTVPYVYYVAPTGIDRADYGTSWDQPWKTIRYACNFISNGVLYPLSANSINANHTWITTELVNWVAYQVTNNLSPFTSSYVLDRTKTVRDAGFILDAFVYDLTRGGNSQTVATTLAYFQYGSTNQFFNAAVTADVPYYLPILNQLLSLINSALNGGTPSQNYQSLNNVIASNLVYQVTSANNGGAFGTEISATASIASLFSILYTALSTASTQAVPPQNNGLTASIFVKTGTYSETLPIAIPENTAVIGDELRGVVIQPATSITMTVYSCDTSLFTVNSTTGLTDQMPVQFVDPNINTSLSFTGFGGVTLGQTYYVKGSTITSTKFGIVASATTTFVGTVTLNSYVITDVVNINGLVVGAILTGSGLPANTIITGIGIAATNAVANTITVNQLGSTTIVNTTITATGAPVTLTSGSGTVAASTVMYAYAGDCLKDMFRLRNATGLRNVTLVGLLGTLSAVDANYIQRPTGGSYCAFDPGTGPNDSSVWIFRRSPYVQNVTTFGNGCSGMKIDGTLHNGGNKSMTSNDFTQIISDGIGIWCYGPDSKTEAVSVFSYYAYSGYLAEAGGRIRATNGNSSYGTYGVIATGFDSTEIPATGIVYNQSTQVQAQVQSSLGTNAQLIKINYSNAGSAYNTTTTNMLFYSNQLTTSPWTNDGNISLNKIYTAPTGLTEAWALTGTSATPGTGYVQQTITINPAGAVYTGIQPSNYGAGTGSNATVTVTVTSTAYTVAVTNGGTGYNTSQQLVIAGNLLGGKAGVNECYLTIQSITGSAILTVSVSGTVPSGSAQNYTLSVYTYVGTASSIDLWGQFSGTSTRTSTLTYNFGANTVTPGSATGFLPVNYGAQQSLVAGWYRLWFTINDTSGLNNQLTFRIYPKGTSGNAGTYSYFYAPQIEISSSTYAPSFYSDTLNVNFTAYANFNVSGSGTGVSTIGDETRSWSVFQTRITDPGSGAGGTGYLTASNNAQAGTSVSIQIAQADTNTAANYTGMRVFINNGTGAGQYGYISNYNASTKVAYVLKESFTSIPIISTNITGNVMTLNGSYNTNTLWVGMPLQFIPTYYTTSVTSTSLAQTTVTATVGGTINQMTVGSTVGLAVNTPITFTSPVFSTVTTGYTYYVYAIIDSVTIQISSQIFGTVWPLSTATPPASPMVMNFSSNTSYLAASTTNMVVNYPIQFTGTALGGLSNGVTYYIQDIIDVNNFTVAPSLVNVTITNTTSGTNLLTVSTTSSLTPLNPIIFSGTVYGNIVESTKYYISSIVDNTTFTIASNIINLNITATYLTTNLIYAVGSNVTASLVIGQPIIFVGNTFGSGLTAETTYYILVINDANTFTVSQTPSGSVVPLNTVSGTSILTGSCTGKTAGASFSLLTASGSMVGTTTAKKSTLTLAIGSMNATFSTQLFGGSNITAGTTYYINTIPSSSTITVTTTQGSGTPVTLASKTGSMNLAALGWDHVTPGQPSVNPDSSSIYYIEPRTTFTAPGFYQATATSPITLPLSATYSAMAYGNNYWMALGNANTTAAVSTDASTWTSIVLPLSATWTALAYGNNYWVAINSTSATAVYSNSNGIGWRKSTLPSNTTWNTIAFGSGKFVALATASSAAAVSTTYGATWTSSTLPASAAWTSVTYGANLFVAVSNGSNNLSVSGATGSGTVATLTFTSAQATAPYAVGQIITVTGINQNGYNGTQTVTYCDTTTVRYFNGTSTTGGAGTITSNSLAAYSTDGITWTTSNLPSSSTWSSIAYGQGRFTAVASTTAYPAYSFDGKTWYTATIPIAADKIAYGQGVFLAISASSTTAWTSESSLDWSQQSVPSASYTALAFGFTGTYYNGTFSALAGSSTAIYMSAGCRTKGRGNITSGVITSISEFEPGSGYTSSISIFGPQIPTVTFTDPNVTSLAVVTPRISNGVLASPTFVNRGSGYNSNSTLIYITGNGYADQYQTGLSIILNNLTRLPSPGDSLTVAGVSTAYKVTSAYAVYGTTVPNLEANVSLSPSVSVANAVANGTTIQIRSKYSQARLTNHDFLNIGYGDFITSNYPGFPANGYVALYQNQTVEANYGRVFYTSTDQDGNFKVGSLFGVQQATGVITLSASQFGLTGLNTLSLGGIAVGGSSVVITQFSTDSTFTANSDSVLPTQKAVKTYLASRLSQGGSNTSTGQLTAGTVTVGNPNYIRSTLATGSVKMGSKVMFQGAGASVDGNMAAFDFFARNAFRRN